tara:strand:+ start:597 stop:869 length:273 start_codon:yes stop_codon:yes gene_type:complete
MIGLIYHPFAGIRCKTQTSKTKKEKIMNKKNNDPFGFNKAINWNKLEDPKVLKELEKLFNEDKPQATSSKLDKPQALSYSRIIKEKEKND